jgi:hypothetical protein
MGIRPRWALVLSLASLATACGDLAIRGDGGAAGDATTTASGGATTSSSTGASGGAGPCASDADCQGAPGGPVCNEIAGDCVACSENADCVGHPEGPICNPETNLCVACFSVPDPVADCGIGQYCDEAVGHCEAGCTGDEDCPSPDGGLFCDGASFTCVGCVADADCPPGALCRGTSCAAGCTADHPCPGDEACCDGQCADLASDEAHCGACDVECFGVNAAPFCDAGACGVGICQGVFQNCNGDPTDGCEHNPLADGECLCAPGEEQPCYLGAPGTLGVGACTGGVTTCLPDGLGWSACAGQVLPTSEICANGVDDDCNGLTDNGYDTDGDGYSHCDGDCDDSNDEVNPGALEITYTFAGGVGPPVKVPGGNGIDDDCDPTTLDEVDPPPCSAAEKLTGVTALDLARALDLCRSTEENPPLAQKTWGLVDAELRRTDGTPPDPATLAAMQDQQSAVLSWFGAAAGAGGVCDGSGANINLPTRGPTMAALSTGRMRTPGHADHLPPEPGTVIGTPSACPADYLAAHGGQLPSNDGALGNCPAGSGCFDGVSLRLRVRVPTNTPSFSFRLQLFSAEYPERLCQPYNDAYLTLVSSIAPGYPIDKNASYDVLGNSLTVNSMFYPSCLPAAPFQCPAGASLLSCTGLHGGIGASSGWLWTDAPVIRGEIITLDLLVFDVSDAQNDTLVLLDGFVFNPPPPWIVWDP